MLSTLLESWLGQFALKRRAFPAIALTTNTFTLTAVADDYRYNAVFSRSEAD